MPDQTYRDEDRPWRKDTRAAETMAQLEAVYRHWLPLLGGDADLIGAMNVDTNTRKAEIRAEQVVHPPPSEQAMQTAKQKLDRIDLESLQATLDYANALEEWANADAAFRKLEAQTYMRNKTLVDSATGKSIANAEADMRTAADEDVADARLAKNIAEGKVKACRSKMEHLERSFEYNRSLMVNERKVDQRG